MGGTCQQIFNTLAPGKFQWNFRYVIFKRILVIDDRDISCVFALIGMSLDFIHDQSTLVQVMAWCRQATSHYLSQCCPRFLSPYGVSRSQWVKVPRWITSSVSVLNLDTCMYYFGNPWILMVWIYFVYRMTMFWTVDDIVEDIRTLPESM